MKRKPKTTDASTCNLTRSSDVKQHQYCEKGQDTPSRQSVGRWRATVGLVCLVCSTCRLWLGSRRRQFAQFNMLKGRTRIECLVEQTSQCPRIIAKVLKMSTWMKTVRTEGCLNVTWSFPIILKGECFHNNMSRLKLLNLWTWLIFKMVSKHCFVYVSYICVYLVFVSVPPFEWRLYW